jgi:predicted nucleotidyltransferase
VITKKQVVDRIGANAVLLRKYGISKIGVFGSYARQRQRAESDIDILIDFEGEKETFDNFMCVCDLLERVFSGHKLDIVTAGGLSPYIGPHILKNVEYVQISS